MNNWFRPSIQQPRWISNTVKSIFTPITFCGNVIKSYWDTWHQVYKPDNDHEKK